MDPGYIPAFTLEPTKRAAPTPPLGGAKPTPRFIDDVAAGRVELPTIPSVVQRLMVMLRDPDIDFRDVGKLLAQDPVLSAKVLRMANSSFFGGQRSMASLDAAVAMIGLQALSRLIVACGVSSTFDAVPGIDLRLFWRDAQVAGVAAHKLAALTGSDPQEAYICGLLHATGHLILCRSYPEIAQAMFGGFAPIRGAELAAVELEAFGIDHPKVGAIWAESLDFPQSVADAIGKTSQPLTQPSPSPIDLVLHCACLLVSAVADNTETDTAWSLLPPVMRSRMTDSSGKPDAVFEKLIEELRTTEPPM